MPLLRCILFCLALLILQRVAAQDTFDIRFPTDDNKTACRHCKAMFARKPKEVHYSIQSDQANNLYFEISDRQWFNEFFRDEKAGIAIDIVTKDRYRCGEFLPDTSQVRGRLLRPVHASELRKSLQPFGSDRFRAFIGTLEPDMAGKDPEFNILFLDGHTVCRYQTIFNLQAYQWDLLDMGMYLDTITYNSRIRQGNGADQFSLQYKTLTCTIPFEKNKATYKIDDIQPLYDSLKLTDFTITRIAIKAYSSIEGNRQRNRELQEQRAESIVRALQSLQKPSIETEVSTAENWVDFLNDISGTAYDGLGHLTKAEANDTITGPLARELEVFLKDHRKAVITLKLEKKDPFRDKQATSLLALFNQSIRETDTARARILQHAIFEKLKRKEANPEILSEMEIPRQRRFVAFFNENSALRYLLDERNMLIAFNEMSSLEKLDPGDAKVKYNLVALELKLWHYNVQPVDEDALFGRINALNDYQIDPSLIRRMLVNYYIVKSEVFMRRRDFPDKDMAVAYVFANYWNIPLPDYDYLSLSQYLSYYSNLDKAIEVLKDKVNRIDVDEDLLFYYLNLTLIDKQRTRDPGYRTIMLNAININSQRFCRLFNSFGSGGVTFQLLEDDYLRAAYCENCTR